jgi:hypothetical protein
MSDMDFELPVDSPNMQVNQGIVRTPKAFSDGLTLDLTDDEIAQALRITLPIKNKWHRIFVKKLNDPAFTTLEQAMKLCDQFEDELKTTLAEKMGLLVSVDVSPTFEGKPPIVDFLGALPGHYSEMYGTDHEKKAWEVKRANDKGEDFLGSSNLN